MWLKSPVKRVIDRIHFTPYFDGGVKYVDKDNEYNIFKGFVHKYDPNFEIDMDKVNPILDLIDILVDHDKECSDYLIKYFAHMIQKPAMKLPVGVVFVSLLQGAGKNSLIDFIGKMVLGDSFYHYTCNWEEFIAKFNPYMETCLFECMDELSSSGGAFKEFNRLKSILSQVTRKIEPKGKDPFFVDDYTRHVFCSNNASYIVKVEVGDRRWFVINADNTLANDSNYFDKFYKESYNLDVWSPFLSLSS